MKALICAIFGHQRPLKPMRISRVAWSGDGRYELCRCARCHAAVWVEVKETKK